MAEALRGSTARLESLYGCGFAPPFPGAPDGSRGNLTSRLVLTCRLLHGAEEMGTVYTTLIAGRPPQVSIAPMPRA